MKARTLFLTAVAIVLFAACKKEGTTITPELSVTGVTDNTITVTNEGGSATFTVAANVDWSVSSTADWVSVSPASTKISDGKKTSTTVTVTVAASKDGKARSAELSVGADNVNLTPVKITVKQTEKIDIIFESDVLIMDFDSEACSGEIEITANKSWAFQSIDADWISVEPESKDIVLGTKTVTKVKVSVTKNESTEARTATLVVKCEGADDIEIAAAQDPDACNISILGKDLKEISEASFGFAGGNQDIVIDTDSATEPEVSMSADWITFVTTEEFVPGEFWNATISADANTTTEAREGTVTFKVKGNETVFTVKQAAGVSIELSVDKITYQAADLTVTPSAENFTYYTTLLDDSYYQKLVGQGYSDAEILYGIAAGNAEYYSMDLPTYLGYVLKMGEYTYEYSELDPATKFTAVCGGMSAEGEVTSACKTLSFTTTEKPAADAAYTELLGTWMVKGNSATYNKETKAFDFGKDDIAWTATVEECVVNESYYFSFQNTADKVSPISGSYYDRFYAGYVPSNGGKAGFDWNLWIFGDMGASWSFTGLSEYCGIIWAGYDATTLEGLDIDAIRYTWSEEKNALVPTDPAAGSFVVTTGVVGESGEYYGYYSGYAQILTMERVDQSLPVSISNVNKANHSIFSKDEIKAFAPKQKFNCVETRFANTPLKVRNVR